MTNPIIWMDYPDPDVIRVDDTYYMVSTTMHFMPGCPILRSYDLTRWEIASYVYETLDDTPAQRLSGGMNIYGQGMWAASIRHHGGEFFVCFVANDTGKTYLFRAPDIRGPWRKQHIEGFYHDASLLFDDDGRVYVAYGNTDIRILELKGDLSGPKPGGLNRIAVSDGSDVRLGYEGAHFYKIRGRYHLFLIHWLRSGSGRRVQACFWADRLDGAFVGGDVLDDDMGFQNAGVAQGGVVDTPGGDWYAMLFQDHGAVGRTPVLVPVHWRDGFPAFGVGGRVPRELTVKSTRPGYECAPLYTSDDFCDRPGPDGRVRLKPQWQWNHNPQGSLWSATQRPGWLTLRTGKLCANLTQAQNTLTQRMAGPACQATVELDAGGLGDGDCAGLCALIGDYGLVAVAREGGQFYLVVMTRDAARPKSRQDAEPGAERARIPLRRPAVSLRIEADFRDGEDRIRFFHDAGGAFKQIGPEHRPDYDLVHFAGCRFGLFAYSTRQAGGAAAFSRFRYQCLEAAQP